ncbi:FERM, ARHGEF and pleckstrin domain-containing protein 2-like isoform X2 [Mya arenaria]|uniref:FERM, ARHGEF and pleckstrin domain-containing protein 2-like isoform X2 n=1 Tax=Mya arenaria TaxID=6604 RepID=UPI0022E077FC|nr:FERM, ARHGEF and pleckstrin domain-containing protein 2-like isoform X2 [Mya arenaria]
MERKGKHVSIRVIFLDDQVHAFQIHVKALGQALWDAVARYLNLLEADYFDLEYLDLRSILTWLDREKQVLKQLPSADTPLYFLVKFYTPDPALLEDELTRYLYALQVKKDLAKGVLTCSDNTMALLASYIAQAEVGDFPIEEYVDHTYLRDNELHYLPRQTEELERKIMEYHKQHVGETPSEADINLLDTARKVELYGIRMVPAKDHENVSLNLAISHCGILVFQGMTKINTFSWAKVRKLSFKRKRFLVKLHPDHNGYYKDLVEFFFDSRDECKTFWKKCIEHHGFFRCQRVKKLPRNKTRVVSRGSSFRYSGRTQRQLSEYVRESFTGKRPQFERTVSGRISSRSSSVTPKISAKMSSHNSADLHNTSASSGSHVLDQSLASNQHVVSEKGDHTDGRSESSGSHSLHSPKLDRADRTLSEEMVPVAGGAMLVGNTVAVVTVEDNKDMDQDANKLSPRQANLGSRKTSAPVLGDHHGDHRGEMASRKLSRTEELENIPDTVVQDDEDNDDGQLSMHTQEHQNAGLMNGHHSKTTPIITTDIDAEEDEVYSHEVLDVENVDIKNETNSNQDTSAPVTQNAPVPQRAELVEVKESTIEMSGDYYPPPPPPLPLEHDTSLELSLMDNGSGSAHSTPQIDMRSNVSGITSNISTLSETRSDDSGGDKRKSKKYPVDKAYYIAKELLMTERTYKKDLEVIIVWFKNAVKGDDVPPFLNDLFSLLEPIYNFHLGFLREVEQRLTMWEGKSNAHLNGDYQRIGDIMVNSFLTSLGPYMNYLEHQDDILMELDKAMRTNRDFDFVYKEFESQKVCYLPLNTFLLKPGQRLLHYKLLLERLTRHYSKAHPDYMDCHATLTKLVELAQTYRSQRKGMENLQKLMELQRDLVGLENLVHPDREFIREGCLQKFSRKGYQQRMFFLFTDMLVYTSRTATQHMQFKVHGQVPLRGMIIEESDHAKMADANSFAIYGGNKCILVAASSQEEKDKWVEDLNESIAGAKSRQEERMSYPSLKSSTSSVDDGEAPPSLEKQIQHRANTTMHVCWHRNTSVSRRDHEKAVKNQLSGYLLRKFNNSNGWQKLWVVFTNFCLYFYKTYQDDFPLASLPLLGYAVSQSEDEDAIHKDNVFKLQFKNHVYFFRAESQYTFERWMEVINSATSSARRTRLFSRMDSTQP